MKPQNDEDLFVYFNRDVLAAYRAKSDVYVLEEDDMGGRLSISADGADGVDQSRWLELLFAFRRLDNGHVCIALFAHDFRRKLPAADQRIWIGSHLKEPVFQERDAAFERWKGRYLHGSWEVEDGPKLQINRLVKLVRALTNQTVGTPLFRFDAHQLVNYPVAENTEAYEKAHLELYRLFCCFGCMQPKPGPKDPRTS